MLEFRLSGSARKYVKQLSFEIADKFHVKGVTKNRVVPHVSIIGPIITNNEQKLVSEVIMACKNHDHELMTAKLCGFMSFGNWLFGKRVLGINIEPSEKLELLRSEFVRRLDNFCRLSEFDTKKWKPHATLAFKDIDSKYGEIKRYLDNTNCPETKHYVARVTLLRNRRILLDYDFLQHRVLNRREALHRENRRLTLILLKERLASDGNP